MFIKSYENDKYTIFKPITRKILAAYLDKDDFDGAFIKIIDLSRWNKTLMFEFILLAALLISLSMMFIETMWLAGFACGLVLSFIYGALEEYTDVERWNTGIYSNTFRLYTDLKNKTNATTTSPSRELS